MERLIRSLKSPELMTECPKCGEYFSMADAILFDGTKEFPPEAEEKKEEYELELQESFDELKKRRISATTRAVTTTTAVNIGQMVEHIVPVLEGFEYSPADCRALFDPIDVIIFEGLSQSKVDYITFMEIKTGGARPNEHQRMIFKALDKGKLYFEEVE